ncbi:hypothetical protein HaLaN_26268, partial [Haematococcus lacustris]
MELAPEEGMLINDAAGVQEQASAFDADDEEDEAGGGQGTARQMQTDVPEAPSPETNVVVAQLLVRGMPFPFLVCSRAVPAGTPLVRSYGAAWWRGHELHFRKACVTVSAERQKDKKDITRQKEDSQLPCHAHLAPGPTPPGAPAGPQAAPPPAASP